jgi:uncharacterized protein
MQLQRFSDPATCSARVGPYLESREAENCIIIGLLAIRSQSPAANAMYCAAVTEGADIRAVAVMTPPYNLLITRDAPKSAMDLIAADLANDGWDVAGVMSETATSLRFAQNWRDKTGHLFTPSMSERLFQLDHVIPVAGVAGQMRPCAATDRPLLRQWLADFEQEALGTRLPPDQVDNRIDAYLTRASYGMYLWEVDGAAVSMAAHTGPTPHGMRVGPVYTPYALRGHGYASALVAALSQILLDSGRQFCFLYTDLANPTSNHIYQTIGYVPLSDVQVYSFA